MQLSFDDSDLDPALNPHSNTHGKYNIQWMVINTDLNSDGNDDAKTINMTVSWDRLIGGDRTVSLDFIKPDM